MGVLDKVLQKIGYVPAVSLGNQEQRSTLSNPDPWLYDLFTGGGLSSGVPVTQETMLSISAVYACCRIISQTVASLPLELYERLPDGDIRLVTDVPEYDVVCVEPHPLYSRYTFDSTSEFHLGLVGNSYNRLYFDRNGRIRRMEILPNNTRPYLKDGELFYSYSDASGRTVVLSDWEVIHFKNISTDGLIGKSPLTVARETFGMGIAANKYAASLYKNGGYMKGVVEKEGRLTEQQLAEVRTSFMRVMQDYENTAGVAILADGMKYKQMSMSPKDAEFIAASKMTVLDVCRYYGVQPHLVAELSNATFSNIEHQSSEFVRDCIRPKVKMRESELNRRILRKSDRGRLFYRYNLDSLLRGDTLARGQFITQMLNNGVFSIDEARALENMNKLPDGLGTAHYRPLNMVEIGKEPDPALLNNDPAATGQQSTDNGTPQAAN